MTDKARNTPLINQLLLILMSVMLLYLVVSFARQVGVSYQRSEELRRIEQKIVVASDERAWLLERLEYVMSLEFLEKWARQHGWTRPDEVLVVTVGEGAESPTVGQTTLEESKELNSPRDAWWDLFFGTR